MARLVRRTWALPLALMLGFVSLYAANPTESNVASHFLFLSYKLDGQDGQYGKGAWDLAFVCFYTIFLSFTREFVMQEVLRPLAVLGGIRSRGKQARFAEQMYTACYIAVVGPLGLYTMKQTPGLWYFETRGMYETYPHTTHGAVFKFYYLFQAAFWVQQAIVMLLGQEKPRKDFRELIAHHIITISLIFFSYRFHFTYIGIAVYVTHDISDCFLAVSLTFSHPSPEVLYKLS
jgi:acyl-CoA-dependent ceramide synthase